MASFSPSQSFSPTHQQRCQLGPGLEAAEIGAALAQRRPLSRDGIMTRSAVIADAGPLIAPARIGQLDLLRGVFGAVLLTPVVAAEIGIDARGAASKAGGNAIRQSLAAG